jgi:hypothetical protein
VGDTVEIRVTFPDVCDPKSFLSLFDSIVQSLVRVRNDLSPCLILFLR